MTTTTEPLQEQQREVPEQELALADLDLPEETAGEIAGGSPSDCDDDWGCGENHNEVLAVTALSTTTTEPQQEQREERGEELALADLDLPQESARDVAGGTTPGGCDDWGCGGNHNEVLAVTA